MVRSFFLYTQLNKLNWESYKAWGVLFLRNVVRAELNQAKACITRELMVDGESYMDTVTIDRIVGVDMSTRGSLLVSCCSAQPQHDTRGLAGAIGQS